MAISKTAMTFHSINLFVAFYGIVGFMLGLPGAIFCVGFSAVTAIFRTVDVMRSEVRNGNK